ncbi:transcriptional regulator [Kineosporia sp. NBRC 101677]|uniref:LCP family glycopolymer transferase n=1 Tax=Kineosporia sp. NBRC 101677 TaxID=3032197 RepID=UPI0024A09ED4|nr:LCP family protein [Kineosporia sp. NBRC 101677]GLY19167.1 transcriptional regulator [Kineosporia sp. NBRC 101677]
MTQVEPFSRRPRRADAEHYGEQSSGQGSAAGDRYADRGRGSDRGGRYDEYAESRSGRSDSDNGGYDPRPGNRSSNGGYDPRPGNRSGNGGYDPRPSDRSGGYDPRPSSRSSNGGYDPRPSDRSGNGGYDPRPSDRSSNGGYDPRPGARSAAAAPERPRAADDREPGGRAQAREPKSRLAAPPPGDENDRRGSHATTYGQGFSWVVAWTIIGALVPGLGLIAAGWRRLGAAVLGVIAVSFAGFAVWALTGNILQRGLSVALEPQKLLMLAIAAVVIGVLWALVVLLTNSQLRRYATLDGAQKAFSWVVVAALVVGVGVPTYTVGNYALVQRDLVNTVFGGDGDEDSDDQKPNTEAADPWADTKRVNVLLIGSDAGETRTGIRPDTMILASIQPSSGNTVLFSLPRNLERVPFKEGSPGDKYWPDGYWCEANQCMINGIWRWAEDTPNSGYAKFKNPGLKATEDAITGVLGLEIDSYAMLNLKGFEEFIDAIGGVELDVYERLPIGGSSTNPEKTKGYIEPGKNQDMDGYHALWFARSRWSTSDYSRMERQRCLIAAVSSQADPVTLATNFPKIAKALKSNMSTSIKQDELQAWVELATRVQGGKQTSLAFTDKVIPDRANPDYDLIHEQVDKAIAKSEKAAKKAQSTQASTPSPSVSATEGTTTTKKPKKPKATGDATEAQDVAAVC